MDLFAPATRAWFQESFDGPTEVQRRGWEAIAAGEHALLIAPTGSGKTLAAFLWAIDRLTHVPEPAAEPAPPGVRVLYVSPLKALVHDIERNLRAPLAGTLEAAQRLGVTARPLRVDVRTGDTPQRDRRRQVRDPAEILATTPESLFLLLGSRARETLRTVTTVIVDEIHALAPTKRGTHLALSLERLCELCAADPQRIGLSATVRPLDAVARFLGGERPVAIVDASARPALDLEIVVPVADMEHVPPPAVPEVEGGTEGADEDTPLFVHQVGATQNERGVWPAVYPALADEIRRNRSTILFVNSRSLCERLTKRLSDLLRTDLAQGDLPLEEATQGAEQGEELVLAHHGSVSHERRAAIESALEAGTLRGIVATSSLELGIDMGAVDRVVMVESPGSVARGLQRAGRSGHRVGETSSAAIYPKFRGDLLECAVVAERMLAGRIEALSIPANPLDVLAQQVVAMCCERPHTPAELLALARRAQPFAALSAEALGAVLDMLTGRFPSTSLADLRPRLRWDRARDVVSARRGTELVSRMNAGTIPDRGSFAVHVGPGGPRIGELDEEMVYESRDGDTFLLGASAWRVEEITRDRVIVSPAPGEGGRLPFWKGDGPGRPVELGRALGTFVRAVGDLPADEAARELAGRLPLSAHAAANLAAYVAEQREHTGTLPTDRAITVERFRDELGDWRVCILSPFGARVHAPWAMAIEELFLRGTLSTSRGGRQGVAPEIQYTDDGIVLRLADGDELPGPDLLFPAPEEVRELVTRRLGDTALFASLFRENAVRSLLVTRRRPDQRNPLWAQRLKTKGLLASVRGYPDFPVVLETYRQALGDVFDLPELERLLEAVRRRDVRVEEVETRGPSPFARSLVYAFVAGYLYETDSPAAERKARALTLDRTLLKELLGHTDLREMIDAGALAELEAELAWRAPRRGVDTDEGGAGRLRDRDDLHDLLRWAGDLSAAEAAERMREDVAPWFAALERERRAARVSIAGDERWIAAEEAGLYASALGVALPTDLPAAFVEPVAAALEALVRRHARTHGPFHAHEVAARFGLPAAAVEPVLAELEAAGVLVLGALRPGAAPDGVPGPGDAGVPEYCDAGVLRRLKRRTLDRLRAEAEAVQGPAFARYLTHRHGLAGARSGKLTLAEAVSRLEGIALPWSLLGGVLLPARVPGFKPADLDALGASGELVWIGRGAAGARDGRVALFRREAAAALLEETDALEPFEPPSEVHAALLAELETRGASFLTGLESAARRARPSLKTPDFEAALWDLVWAGRITNDTLGPLRALRAPRRGGGRRGARTDRLAGGRWWLVSELLREGVTVTERAVARASMLLDRYGIVSREAARTEGLPGGFGPTYRALRAMEDAGRVQRGWFVAGLPGAQFALRGAVDRLRDLRASSSPGGTRTGREVVLLPALDPANPWGALLAWPRTASGKGPSPRRVTGAWVVLLDGAPAVYLSPRRNALATFPSGLDAERGDLETALAALRDLPRERGRRWFVLETIDGVPVLAGGHGETLVAAGFVPDYRGFTPDR